MDKHPILLCDGIHTKILFLLKRNAGCESLALVKHTPFLVSREGCNDYHVIIIRFRSLIKTDRQDGHASMLFIC